ncbi:MAG: chromate transporter [Clostridia bacterium]|nr:chromate transporter [Clostridia bacterium]
MADTNYAKKQAVLYGAFFKVGLFTFGGGYAMLPMLQKECVEKHGWTDDKELLDVFALAQCTPGIIAVNTATFLGKKQAGFLGAVFATLGVITPSLVIISLIAALLKNFADIPAVRHALAGVRVAVTGLILASVFKMGRNALKHWLSWVIALVAFLLVALFGTSPVYIVLGAALAGYLFFGGLWTGGKEGDA